MENKKGRERRGEGRGGKPDGGEGKGGEGKRKGSSPAASTEHGAFKFSYRTSLISLLSLHHHLG